MTTNKKLIIIGSPKDLDKIKEIALLEGWDYDNDNSENNRKYNSLYFSGNDEWGDIPPHSFWHTSFVVDDIADPDVELIKAFGISNDQSSLLNYIQHKLSFDAVNKSTNTIKKQYVLVQDTTNYWYVIPVNKKIEWDEFCALQEPSPLAWHPPKWAIKVGGSPSSVIFSEYSIEI